MSSYLRIYDGQCHVAQWRQANGSCWTFTCLDITAFNYLFIEFPFENQLEKMVHFLQEHHQEGGSLKNTVPVIIQRINLICSARHMNFTSDSRIQTKTSKTSLSRLFAVCIHVIFNFLFMINLKKLLALFLIVCPTKQVTIQGDMSRTLVGICWCRIWFYTFLGI